MCVCVYSYVQGPTPPCPLTLERLRGVSVQIKSWRWVVPIFFFLFNTSSTPPPQSAHFFLTFFMQDGENETWRNVRGRGKREVGVLGSENKWKQCFFHKGSKANCAHCHTQTPAATVTMWKFLPFATWSGFYCSHLTLHTNTRLHFFSVYYFPTFLSPHFPSASLHPTTSSLLSLLSDFPHPHVWQRVDCSLAERKLSFHSISLTAPHTVYLLTYLIIIPFGPTMYESTLSCVILQRFLFILAVRTTQRRRQRSTHTHQMHPDRVSGPFLLLPLLQAE